VPANFIDLLKYGNNLTHMHTFYKRQNMNRSSIQWSSRWQSSINMCTKSDSGRGVAWRDWAIEAMLSLFHGFLCLLKGHLHIYIYILMVLTYVTGWVYTTTKARSEARSKLKNQLTSTGIKLEIIRRVAKCLNKLCYRMPPPQTGAAIFSLKYLLNFIHEAERTPFQIH
jgi:hypothetical protein